MKVFYVSRELLRRGIRVSWYQKASRSGPSSYEGISLSSFLGGRFVRLAFLPKFLAFCKSRGTKYVYIDEWLFLRHRPLRRVPILLALRAFGISIVLDQRDPYIQDKITSGILRVGSRRYRALSVTYSLTYQLANMIIAPSVEYGKELARIGAKKERTLGIFRGVDSELFNTTVEAASLRRSLNLDGRFVIGWVGSMTTYRRIDEVLIPLIRKIRLIIPNSVVLIGGKGPLLERFTTIRDNEPNAPMKLLGFIPYRDLPKVLACCDVLLAPSDNELWNTRLALSLKIAEAIAIGKPVVASRTQATEEEWRDMGGVVWVGRELDEFLDALKEIHGNYAHYAALAREQAMNFERYTTKLTISSIVDGMVQRD